RTDSTGNIVWNKFVGGTADDELQNLIRVGNDYYLVGSTRNYGAGNAQIYFTKMDDSGDFYWFKIYDSSRDQHSKAIINTQNNNLVLGVYSRSYGNGSYSFMLMKTDNNGNILWTKAYLSSNDDIYRDLIETGDQGYLSVGFSNSFGSGDYDFYLVKTDNTGKVQWAKTYGGPADDKAFNIKKLNDGNYMVCGVTSSFGAGGSDVFIIKINPEGNLIWAKTYGGTEDEDFSSVDIANNEGLIITASTYSYGNGERDFFLVKTDNEGNSCCSQVVDNTTVKNVSVTGTPVFPTVSQNSEFPYYDIDVENQDLEQKMICVDSLKIIGDSVICENQLNIYYYVEPNIDGDYLWSVPENATIISGQGTLGIVVNFGGVSGFISVSLQNSCSLNSSDSLYVNISENINLDLGPDTSFCYGQSVLLSPGGGFYSYYWQDGSTDSVLLAGNTGYYWVQVTDSAGCTATDSVYIEAYMEFSFSLGPDTSRICEGDYLILHGPGGYASYTWQDGSGYPDLIADTSGIYWLEVTAENGCAARDSMLLIVNRIPVNFLGNDTVLCEGGSFSIHAPPVYDKYIWQDGSSDSVFIARQAGDYWVYVEDSIGCSGVDTISLSLFEPPQLSRSGDTLVCPGDSLRLTPGEGMLYYKWNTGSTDSAITVTEEGDYWVEMGTNCGTFTDSILVDLYSDPDFSPGPDTNICGDETIRLSAGPGFRSYLWGDGSTDSVLTVHEPGIYPVVIDDGRCLLSGSVKVDKCNLLWIPNVFTPNNDGYNDYFYAVGENVIKFEMVIYNRWGVKMATLNNIEQKWDGRYNGVLCTDGVYYYEAVYEEVGRDTFPVKRQVHGSVTLISGR
ncbi:MAG TPA: T9SS type B sorting domain-containing protein, partial [Bacteroidetes bacterium]|nr:T9SS type B sorting domain-containing protein [Bacteroidota bacterium]